MKKLIFISHRESEAKLASHLVDFLLASLQISETEIRCTSVPGHQLPFGKNISQQLKKDINISSAVIVLLTKQSLKSNWVLFELGASWALSKIIIPIIAPGLSYKDLPGPLNDFPCIQIDKTDAISRMKDGINQVATVLNIDEKPGGRAHSKLEKLIEEFRKQDVQKPNHQVNQAKAFEISWLIMTILSKQNRQPTTNIESIKSYLNDLELNIIEDIETHIKDDDKGTAGMKLLELIGGRLMAKHPKLIDFFQAGVNLLLDATRNNGKNFNEMLKTLTLPKELTAPKEDKLKWANEVHDYFVKILLEN